MCHMLYRSYEILHQWIGSHPRSFPPIVVHITDGESQDGDPIPYADAVKSLTTEDGNVFAVQLPLVDDGSRAVHVSRQRRGASGRVGEGCCFASPAWLPDPFYRHGVMEGFALQPNARGDGLQRRHGMSDSILEHGNAGLAPGLRVAVADTFSAEHSHAISVTGSSE